MGSEEAMRLEIEELIEEKTALRAQLMGNTTAEAIKMAFDNGDSYLESVLVRAKRAEADRDALRAQLAAANSMLGTWEAITRKTAEKDGVQYVGPNTASAISDVATARAEKAEAELKAANERAEKAEALADHQATGVDRLSALNDAISARVAELEGAIRSFLSGAAPCDRGKLWPRSDVDELENALARTPAQSLAKVQAAALSAMAKTICEGTEHPVALAVVHLIQTEAERLEAEAANGPQ